MRCRSSGKYGELDPIDTAQWLAKVMRCDYTVALNLTANDLDDPDQTPYENHSAPRAAHTTQNRSISTTMPSKRPCVASSMN